MGREDISPGVLRQRRNVIGLSLAVIVFEIAGGELLNRAGSPIGFVKFDNPDYLLYFAYVALAYSVWRLWLYSTEEGNSYISSWGSDMPDNSRVYWDKDRPPSFYGARFEREFQVCLTRTSSYRKLIRCLYVELDLENSIHDYTARDGQLKQFPMVRRGFFVRKIYWNFWVRVDGNMGVKSGEAAGHPDSPVTKISWIRFQPTEIAALFRAAFYERTFSDEGLPYLLAGIAALFVSNRFIGFF